MNSAFVPLSKTGAELLFEMLSQRYERGSTMVTSNLPFAEWTEVLGSERLTGALLDRLTPPRPHPGDERRQLPPQAEQTPTHHVQLLSPHPRHTRAGSMASSATLQKPHSPETSIP